MKIIVKRAIVLVGVFLVALTVLSAYELPQGVRFVAPHKGHLDALAARISMNPRLPARLVDRILQISVPTVHAQSCYGKPACDGNKMVADPTGVHGTPNCWFDGTTYSCTKATCQYVGGSHLCNGPYTYDCKITGHPGVMCSYATNVSCQ